MNSPQLTLAVQLREPAGFDNFYAGPNAEPLLALRGDAERVFIYGPPASGRTHLLQACARERGAAYLPLRDIGAHGPDALDGYADAGALCLDDVDAVAADRAWCVALLRLLDARGLRGARTLASAAAAPERIEIALPDLRTRFAAFALYGLRPLSDADRAQLLRERALARGLELPEDCSRWLLTRLARDTGSLLAALEKLDQAALTERRRLTLPFVQAALSAATAHTTPVR